MMTDEAISDAEVYRVISSIARRLLAAERRDHSYWTCDLVHEAALVLGSSNLLELKARAAPVLRRLLMERARRRNRLKRGGGWTRIPLEEDTGANWPLAAVEKEDVHEALKELERVDRKLAELVECRFFAAMTCEELAVLHGVSTKTIENRWRIARGILFVALREAAAA